MLPYFSYVHPEIARNLLIYRYRTLPGARAKARRNGCEGAQYAWESTLDGMEATPDAIIHPESGEMIPILNGPLELHISASIAYANWQYWRITGDDEFMRDYGAEIVLSTAAFWASRVEYNVELGDYEINNVIGPDEWHEHVNNNAFTNYMASWNIQSAIDVLDWLQSSAPAKAQPLAQQIGLNETRLDHSPLFTPHIHIPPHKQTSLFHPFHRFLHPLP